MYPSSYSVSQLASCAKQLFEATWSREPWDKLRRIDFYTNLFDVSEFRF